MRDHTIKGEPYYECWMCGWTVRRSDTRVKDGMRFCSKCYSVGEYAHPAWIGWPSSFKGNGDFGVMVFRGEYGAIPQKTSGEYGVMVGVQGMTASVSNEYGTVVGMPDFKLETEK
jgi:hypothetical protein